MSLPEDDSTQRRDPLTLILVAGSFALAIACVIGSFLTFNKLLDQGYFAREPDAQAVPPSVSDGLPGTRIGFDFSDQLPVDPAGDGAAATHLFIHYYPFPADGLITGVTYLNDREPNGNELPETVTLLVLRAAGASWEIVHRFALAPDDDPGAKSGITTLRLDEPLLVQKGDVFAHWQPGDRGPIPLNYGGSQTEGRSEGRVGFSAADLAVGQLIDGGGFTGNRDYFINLIFEAAKP